MAKFWEVHKIPREADALHFGDYWRIAIREPLGNPDKPGPKEIKLLALRLGTNRRLSPATQADIDLIADWEKRHEATPAEHFNLPDFLFRKAAL